ncbi:MAG: extracellular solute-binding protein [Rhodospirillales bacterium]|nr:extracellular solute-binding protein [Rhodospirillales bacterium]
MIRRRTLLASLSSTFSGGLAGTRAHATAPPPARTDAVSVLGPPALPPGFTHFPYVNPGAPKGGSVTLFALGGFDSFNPYILRGTPASGLVRLWDTLLTTSADEAGTGYAHLAEAVEISPDRATITFTLDPAARFYDGTAVTAADVVFTFHALVSAGQPFYRLYYSAVGSLDAPSRRAVRFHLRSVRSRELPLILGELPVLPAAFFAHRDFSRPLSEPPFGSGPYRIGTYAFDRSITYQRNLDYWAADRPTARGLFNFDTIHTEYFRDDTVAFEAFKAGNIDFRNENISKNWATSYDFPAVRRGLVKRRRVRYRLPTGMQGFAMNTRRAIFADPRVRKAMAWAFNFRWENKNLFYGLYTRSLSYFSNSDLASSGLPEGAELALLEPWRKKLPPELFTEPFTLPEGSSSGIDNKALLEAFRMLEAAGWHVAGGRLVNHSGQPFVFEILLPDPTFERVALPYTSWLKRLGITATVRIIDPAQYQRRMNNFDFDMTMTVIPESEIPGNEQRNYWTCAAAHTQGSQNLMGVCSPVVDALVEKLIAAPDRPSVLAAAHALDRVLLWGWYMVPQWHSNYFNLAYWNRFGFPTEPVRTGYVFDAWWIDETLAAATDAARRAGL